MPAAPDQMSASLFESLSGFLQEGPGDVSSDLIYTGNWDVYDETGGFV